MGKTFFYNILIFITILLFTNCSRGEASPERFDRFALNTLCQITLYEEDSAAMAEAAFDEVDRLENTLSRHIATSELGRLNGLASEALEKGEDSVSMELTAETADLMRLALGYAAETKGRFNPAVGPLVDLWGIGTENARIPGKEEIDGVRPFLDWKNVVLEGNVVTIKSGMSLDLGGIAKGYAADRIKEVLEDMGARRGIINFGGNVLVMGNKPDGALWNIGLQNPLAARGDYVGILSLEAMSMVTSGNYERYFEVDGVRYHHILDSATGFPVNNNLAAVTIVTPLSAQADGLSTSLYSMGLEEGMAFAEDHDYFEALFITKDNRIYMSSGLKDSFRLTNGDFTLSNL